MIGVRFFWGLLATITGFQATTISRFGSWHNIAVPLERREENYFQFYFLFIYLNFYQTTLCITAETVVHDDIDASIQEGRILIKKHFTIFLMIFRANIDLPNFIEYTFFNLKIINKNIHKNILEILDQSRFNIKVTFLYFSTNQLETQNKNILENPDQKLINRKFLGSETNK